MLAFWSFCCCDIVALLILVFPISLLTDSMVSGTQKILCRFIFLDTLLAAIMAIVNITQQSPIVATNIKTSLLLIPVLVCVFFSAFLYYPAVKFLVKTNIDDQKLIDAIMHKLFICTYGDINLRESSITDIENFCETNRLFIVQYKLDVYLDEYLNHINNITHRPNIDFAKFIIEKCSQVKDRIDHFNPNPFSNVGLVLSFVFSTLLTILLSVIEIVP